MKKLILTFIALFCATVSYAQEKLVATLSHGENLTMYYGAAAFGQALNNAAHGDVISLSGGKFDAATITKAVSIRGAGMDAPVPTEFESSIYVQLGTTEARLSIEGIKMSSIYFKNSSTTNNASIIKCSITQQLSAESQSVINDLMVVNCNIKRTDTWNASKHSIHYVNCYLDEVYASKSNNTRTNSFVNCVLVPYNGYLPYLQYSTLINCIIATKQNDNRKFPDTSTARNCLAYGYSTDVFSNQLEGSNNKVQNTDCPFINSEDWTSDLTEEAKATYIGTDGTPIGMYGGPMPFSYATTYPQISKMNVSTLSTADGKLNVDIQVSSSK